MKRILQKVVNFSPRREYGFYLNMKSCIFRTFQWDPILLISQICCMQFSVYFTLGFLQFFASGLSGENYAIHEFFKYDAIHVSDVGGRLVICAFVLNSFISSLALWAVVKRAKLCLDFSCTFHGIHLILCWWYNSSFPSNISWWLLNGITTTIMCIGGEFLCLKSELKEIPVLTINLYRKKVAADRTGIVTPYQKQVQVIRSLFNEAEAIKPKIGTVEEFQEQERDIIIISTVRSSNQYISSDIKYFLGFFQSTKRMNVAISRARYLLYVCGNPHILTLDSCWSTYIKYCVANDSYFGCDLPRELCPKDTENEYDFGEI